MNPFDIVHGVDFSGAKLAGLNAWVACVELNRKRVVSLDRLGDLAGNDERAVALAYLANRIVESRRTLWGIDFPFALPLEVVDERWTLGDQLGWLRTLPADAYAFGRSCVETALARGHRMHVRRETDKETKTPFDCYHYRIVCQTFYGMRDVLGVIHHSPGTVVPPFDALPDRFERAVVEACPGSTLKRWGVPHNNYKQPAGGPLEPKRIKNRRIILDRLKQAVEIEPKFIRRIQRNGGGDALDAVLAAVGAWESWQATDFLAVAAHPRYSREGRIFA